MDKETKTEEINEQTGIETDEEEIKEYMEEDFEDSGYKEHTFSLFDNPLEIFALIFMVAYLVYAIWKFADILTVGTTVSEGFDYWLGVVARMIPAIVLLVCCEIYESIQLLEYNVKLNSYYMARYQMNVMSKLDK